MNPYFQAARRLLGYLYTQHWNGHALTGPDPIGKINWRISRFIKSYTQWLPWKDNFEYSQGQGYWIAALVRFHDQTGDERAFRSIKLAADYLARKQLPSGAWKHPPLRERRGYLSAVETVWASLGLATAYEKTENSAYLDSALRGFESLINILGFQKVQGGLALNYYAHSHHAVPNVTTMFLRLQAQIYKITGDARVLINMDEMIRFLEISQLESGELSYVFNEQSHFQCFQYNSFEFVDLVNFYILSSNLRVKPLLSRLAHFLSGGLSKENSCRYDCHKEYPEVNYWTSALAIALWKASQIGIGEFSDESEKLFNHLLYRQKPNGGFNFSQRNYWLLSDQRSYPRQQAMILDALLQRSSYSIPAPETADAHTRHY